MRTRTALLVMLCLALAFTPAPAKKSKNKGSDEKPEETPTLSSKTFSGLKLRGIGPALMSGRISDIAIHPEDQSVWYVAVASGGLWKTVNRGNTWTRGQ